MALSTVHRLKRKADITDVFTKGTAFHGAYFFLKILSTKDTKRLWVIIVSNKTVPRVVLRNRLRRTTSEILRMLIPQTTPGYRAALTIRKAELPDAQHIKEELLSLLKKSGILAT